MRKTALIGISIVLCAILGLCLWVVLSKVRGFSKFEKAFDAMEADLGHLGGIMAPDMNDEFSEVSVRKIEISVEHTWDRSVVVAEEKNDPAGHYYNWDDTFKMNVCLERDTLAEMTDKSKLDLLLDMLCYSENYMEDYFTKNHAFYWSGMTAMTLPYKYKGELVFTHRDWEMTVSTPGATYRINDNAYFYENDVYIDPNPKEEKHTYTPLTPSYSPGKSNTGSGSKQNKVDHYDSAEDFADEWAEEFQDPGMDYDDAWEDAFDFYEQYN